MPRGKNRKRENPAPTENPSAAAAPEGNGFVQINSTPNELNPYRGMMAYLSERIDPLMDYRPLIEPRRAEQRTSLQQEMADSMIAATSAQPIPSPFRNVRLSLHSNTFNRAFEHEQAVDLGPDPFAARTLRETTLSRGQRVKERAREIAAEMGLPYSDRIERLILEMAENGLGIGTGPDTRAAGAILAAMQRATLLSPAVKTALEGRTLITDRNGNTVFEGPGTLKDALELMARTGRPIENVDFRPSTSSQSYPEWKQLDLSRAVFTGCKFEMLSIMYSTLYQARFVNCEFSRTGFWHSRLTRTRFDRCTFKGGDFVFSDLSGVVFEGCDLGPGYDFSHCKLQDIRFEDCRFNYQSHSQMAALLEADFWRTSGEVTGPEPSDNTKLVDRLALVRTLPSLAGNYCFNSLLTLDHPAKNWALAVIAKSLKPGDQQRLHKTLVYAFKRRGLLPEWWANEEA